MAIFGRNSARQRLRRATRESLTTPAFSSPIDCTPWVIGGLWPVELSTITDENAAVAEHLRGDLQRITSRTNDELKVIRRAGLNDAARHAAEVRVIDEARSHAARRVESALRQLYATTVAARPAQPQYPRRPPPGRFTRSDDTTRVMPAVRAQPPPAVTEPAQETTEVIPAARVVEPAEAEPETSRLSLDQAAEPEAALDAEVPADEPEFVLAAPEVATPQPETPAPASEAPVAEPEAPAAVDTESDIARLQRLLAFVVRQEPQLNWAVGDHADGTTVLVTDLAHGWVPPGIALPAGVRLLEPGRRFGKVVALLGEMTRAVTYTPGDRVGRAADFAPTDTSVQPRELPAVEDFGWELGRVTHWRDGLPRLVHTLAKAAAAGTGVVEEEADLLRVHLDTARYQVLTQYPEVDPALLLNCLLLAATESSVAGDAISANYHFAWFQKLDEPPASQWTAES
ncbi:DUF5631 domain-containing protein [Mycobacterium shigaense]|uniref:DUF5631 domain-containing protein n=1 Tax=Mycobacterium shigaense TaxID=722731 RepID=UPI000BBB2AF2|nr:DUF5631 domain-containing protein [Mycobacterium shigaense]PRI15252.1 hypothetical protein B2J96_12650 [Mycobacterium shigaense]